MYKYKVLVTLPWIEKHSNALQILEKEGCEVVRSPYPACVKEKDLLKITKNVDAIIAGGDEFTARVIEAADKLKVIARYGVGVDKVDVEAATRKKITVAIAPNQNAVADLTFGLLLCLARRICEANTFTKSGGWGEFFGTDVWQKTLGVIGAGRVGQAVIKRAKGFDMRVSVYDIYRDEKLSACLGFEYTSLERVLREADFLTLHLSLNEKTWGLIGKDELVLMKPSAYLINTARAQIVDEDALYKALKEKRIAGAALDVYSQVPPPKDFPFFALDNVITTPWIASATAETRRSMELTCVENILRVFRGEKPLYAVNLLSEG